MGDVYTLQGCVLQFTPETLTMINALRAHAASKAYDVHVVHGIDGQHSGAVDPHPFGKALDVRTHDVPDPDALRDDLQSLLGPRYTVLLEDRGQPNEHLHVQLHRALWQATVPPELLARAQALDAHRDGLA